VTGVEAMRLAVYGAVLVIALGSVLLGLDRIPAPMSPMVDTVAGLQAAVPPPPPAPPSAPTATMGAPIVPPALSPPASPAVPEIPAAAARAAVPVAAPEQQVHCNVSACTAAYRSFRPSDCTYQPTDGPRRLCTK